MCNATPRYKTCGVLRKVQEVSARNGEVGARGSGGEWCAGVVRGIAWRMGGALFYKAAVGQACAEVVVGRWRCVVVQVCGGWGGSGQQANAYAER